ncbi:MAG: extracellular solute-binding protein [Chloroflexota bacterium]
MNYKERQRRLYVAKQGEKLRKGRISRREFLRRIGIAGFGISAAGMMRWDQTLGIAPRRAAAKPVYQASADMEAWLSEVGGQFAGSTIRISSESTAPSQITSELAQEVFTPLTGIEVQWEQTPLDQVLSKITLDTATQSASNDIYYLDQAWLGRFVNDTVDVQEVYLSQGDSLDLNYPGYNFDDFVPELVPAIAAYQGSLVGVPFDIPIFIMSYRTDVFAELGLEIPTTMPEYLAVCQAIDAAGLTNADLGIEEAEPTTIRGTAGQWRTGHYALQCDWTAWLWSHGGSHVNADGVSVINDAAGLEGAEYMLALGETMPAGSTTWDWSGQGDAVGQGLAGIVINWGEFFPSWDNPDTAKVAGLMDTAPLPMEAALRSPDETAFDEVAAIGHQGGSCLALSSYSEQPDAAWVFLQWATSPETILAAAAQSNSPVRTSTYETMSSPEPGVGTTRHFPITLETIQTRMGTEPHFPSWAPVSGTGGPIPTELGLMVTGEQDAQTTLDNIAAIIDQAVADDRENGLL